MGQTDKPSRTRAKSINQRIGRTMNVIDSWSDRDVREESDSTLTNLWSAIKNLEDSAEEARKQLIEPEMKSRVSPGERLCGVHLIQSHRKSVEEGPATVIGRAASRGLDYTQFVTLDVPTLAEDYPELVTITENEYTYFR